ncbi:hypothetical protein HLB23_13160 [Nocardia uniformis]|uniref:Uncharacterized protein n=1 Tax=Nocardia uniformis TaxID=53432 RepID=A0A849BW67_9NOCA|nr:hypothetical protein [Nocardia uniformis]NNH70802.1 hypothetical protein [Nocardia uniformis]
MAFALAIYLIPEGHIWQRLAVSASVVGLAGLLYLGIIALLTADRRAALTILLAFATFGAATWYGALVVGERDSTIAERDRTIADRAKADEGATATAPPISSTEPTTSPAATPPATATGTRSVDRELPDFGIGTDAILAGGTVRVELDHYGVDLATWTMNTDNMRNVVHFTTHGISLLDDDTTRIALLSSGESASFPTCRAIVSGWTSELSWQQVERGTFACLRTRDGRRGIMRFNEIPDQRGSPPAVVVEGRTWKEVVDR